MFRNTDLDRKQRCVIGSRALLQHIYRLIFCRKSPGLRPFLQRGFGVAHFRLQGRERRIPEMQDETLCRFNSSVEIKRRDHSLAGPGKDCALLPSAASRFPGRHDDE